MAVQGLQRRFLYTLSYHYFNTVVQDTKTVQEIMNDLTKYGMVQPPGKYMFQRRFISALCETLCNDILKKGYNTEANFIEQLYKVTCMLEEAFWYNSWICEAESMALLASRT